MVLRGSFIRGGLQSGVPRLNGPPPQTVPITFPSDCGLSRIPRLIIRLHVGHAVLDDLPQHIHVDVGQLVDVGMFGTAGHAPAGEDVDDADLAFLEIGRGKAVALAARDRRQVEGRRRFVDQGRRNDLRVLRQADDQWIFQFIKVPQ